MLMPKLDAYFLKVSAHGLLKLAAKDSIRGKKSENLAFLHYFFEAKTGECDPENWSSCNRFGIIISCSITYNAEMSVHVSLKVTTKASLRGKKAMKI